MKISVSGKGGSGKSTVVALLAFEARDRGIRPLVVDADESNAVLYRMLGFPEPPAPLVDLAGGRQMVRKLMPPRYVPREPGLDTNVLSRDKLTVKDIPASNIVEKEGIRLVTVGKIVEPLEGCACPMGVLVREFLGRLQLEPDEIVIVDTEAGIEHFGRGVETSVDAVLIVVEPSFESLVIAEKIKALAHGIGIHKVFAVLNKVTGELAPRLKARLAERDIPLIGVIPYDEEIFNACLDGRPLVKGKASAELSALFDAI